MKTFKLLREHVAQSSGVTESWLCIDCGVNTAPGCSTRAEVEAVPKKRKVVGQMQFNGKSEVYTVRAAVWGKTGLKPFGGCLCIGCIEKRLGRKLRPKDFEPYHIFNDMPGTTGLMKRRDD
jgi:hypothetical protein